MADPVVAQIVKKMYADEEDAHSSCRAEIEELKAELARWKAAWPDPDEYAAALRKELGQGDWHE